MLYTGARPVETRSLPSRERGLKSCRVVWLYLCIYVAPFAGAWIEMINGMKTRKRARVAPFAGARIEICTISRARTEKYTSLPSRERGLKFCPSRPSGTGAGSLPLRERGLKSQYTDSCILGLCVAPFTGAWIEMFADRISASEYHVAPFTGAWIEIRSPR